jgi:predicted N-acyltransferase
VLYQDSRIISIAPLFVTDFNGDIAAEGITEKIIHGIRKYLIPRFLVFKTLFCGSPFGENGILGIKEGICREDAIAEIVRAMYKFCIDNEITLTIFKDFLAKDGVSLDCLASRGFFKVKSFPSVTTELNFSSFDEYLQSLKPSTRKSLRKKIKKAYSSAEIRIETTENIDRIAEEVFRLYENIYHSGTTKFERLTKEFFVQASKNLKPYSKFFLYYVNDRLSAFNLCFVYADLFIDKFIGFDYEVSRKYNLYFVSWCFNVEWCLKNSIRFYQTGQTDYHPKLKLGGRLLPLYAYLKHRNPFINVCLKLLAVLLRPENFDQDIRKNADI